MADKILTEDDVRQIARDEANYAIGKHREQDHEANGPDAESVARTVGVAERAAVEALRAAANDDLLTADQLRMSDQPDDAAAFTKSAGRLRRRADRIERGEKP